MQISTIIGLAGAFGSVIVTLKIEGGHLSSFVNFGALILILGGSIAVAITSFSLAEVLSLPKYIMTTIFPPKMDAGELIVSFVSFSEKARREGLLALEEDVSDIEDKLTQLGLELVIDGTDPEIVRNIMENLSDSMKKHEKIPAEFFETLGGFSPTLGIIGTVMGLVHVLEGLGGAGMEQLGRGIAVAFIATFYGIGFANLLWLPLCTKIKNINHQLEEMRNITIDGVLSIQSGENPRIVKERLICNISEPEVRKKVYEVAGTGE